MHTFIDNVRLALSDPNTAYGWFVTAMFLVCVYAYKKQHEKLLETEIDLMLAYAAIERKDDQIKQLTGQLVFQSLAQHEEAQ